MPKYRSITLSIMSQWEMKQFPEFPHPDSAQYKCRVSSESAAGYETWRPASASTSSTSTSKADNQSDRDATMSCYIPSIPGIRFFLKYAIEPPHPEGQLFYFKLFMNGRHISSWGVDPKTSSRGQVLRGLFEPGGTWSASENGRTVLKRSGIEYRPFLFTPDVDGRSAADDGGLVEVRVFRAEGRKRRAPILEAFRPQEQYGISLPSAGLLDKPQDTRYYDFILVDPKDEPYAAFLFHYRSWEFLQSLQLIPSSHPRALLKPSNSFAFLAEPPTNKGSQEDNEAEKMDHTDEDNPYWVAHEESPRHMTHISQLHSSKISEATNYRPIRTGIYDEGFESSSLPFEQKTSPARIPISAFSVPQATLDEWAYERPLPRLPKAKPSFDHSRNSSTSSNAPSITPSLLPWLDLDSDNHSPEPILGVAVSVPVPSLSPIPDELGIDCSSNSSADWSLDTPSQRTKSVSSMSNPFVIPPEAIFLPSSVTIRKSRRKTSRSIPAQGRLLIEDSDNEDSDPDDRPGRFSSRLLEAEGLFRQQGLSPTKKNSRKNEVALQRSLAKANTIDRNDPVLLIKEKHMAWAVNSNEDQQTGESNSQDRHTGNPLVLKAVPGSYGKPNYGKPEWI